MFARIVLISLALASATATAGERQRNDTTLAFTIEKQGSSPAIVSSGVVAEINDESVPAKTTLTRDTTYVAARKTEVETVTLVPNTVREGVEVELTNTSSASASVNIVLDMLRGIQAIDKGAGSIATTQRHQVAMEVGTGKEEQNIRIDGKDYKITTVYTPGDSVMTNTGQAEKSKKPEATKADPTQEAPAKQEASADNAKSTKQSSKQAQKKKRHDETDEHGHPKTPGAIRPAAPLVGLLLYGRHRPLEWGMTTRLRDLPQETLDQLAWHDLDVEKLTGYCNPLGAWIELKRPITKDEVQACLDAGSENLAETPLWTEMAFGRVKLTQQEARDRHVSKIAYFVKHGIERPINLDVGVPSMGYFSDHFVTDGNHRLAGALLRGDKTIAASVCGSETHAKELGLWNPNRYFREDLRRWRAAQRETSKETQVDQKPGHRKKAKP